MHISKYRFYQCNAMTSRDGGHAEIDKYDPSHSLLGLILAFDF